MLDLKSKLANLPTEPGVYFFKNDQKKIIYIGKAAVLKNRVSSYFQASTVHSPKNQLLLTQISDVDWITVGSEVEALFLESEFIKRYKPQFNIELKDDKQFIFIKVTTAEQFPVVSYIRRPLDDNATYFGPFTSSDAVRRAMKMLRRAFPYVTHETLPARACLQFHLGLCPGPEIAAITSTEYRRNIKQLMMYLRGQQAKLIQQLEKNMLVASKRKNYEAAGKSRDQLRDLKALSLQMIFGDKEAFDLSKDQALVGLADRLGIPVPRRIEGYDISHLQGTDNVASMVVFTDGVPNRDQYRKFKMKLAGNDDFAHMREVILRRFSKLADRDWPKPDLILIDGGKGQLMAALDAMEEKGINIPTIGLAKREEEIIRVVASSEERVVSSEKSGAESTAKPTGIWPGGHESTKVGYDHGSNSLTPHSSLPTTHFEIIQLPRSSHVLQLLQRVRDESHRFAVTYHSLLRAKRQTRSLLDNIPGVGPATRKRLVKVFGSARGVKSAGQSDLAAVVGPAKAKIIKEYIR